MIAAILLASALFAASLLWYAANIAVKTFKLSRKLKQKKDDYRP